ncbi:MAG: PAS domain S-box protein [Tepidisphaeraceae bacterium]|jgi:PAS domain S-box-containing protein
MSRSAEPPPGKQAFHYAYGLRLGSDGVIGCDWCSDSFARFTGYTFQDWAGRGWDSIIHPDDRPLMADRPDALRAGKEHSCELRIVTAAGQTRRVYDCAHPLPASPGQSISAVALVHAAGDAAALNDIDSRYAAILSTTVDGIVTINQRGIIESFNPAAQRLFGYSSSEVIGQNVNILMPEPYRTQHDTYLANYLTTGQAKIIGIGREVSGRRRDGSLFPMYLAVSEVRLADRPGAGMASPPPRRLFTGIIRDLSDQKRLERQLLEISDRERRRIGQDLHDGLGQQLAGIGFLSKSLENRLAAKALEESVDARKIADLVAQAIGQARGLARGLHPVELKSSGLMFALNELAASVQEVFRIRCRAHFDDPVLLRDNTAAIHLYRIAQEAVHNAIKHGRARNITITLSRSGKQVTLQIDDDGSGFTPPVSTAGQSKGLGLHIMQYRAALIGGSLDIGPGPTAGTRIVVSFASPD